MMGFGLIAHAREMSASGLCRHLEERPLLAKNAVSSMTAEVISFSTSAVISAS